MAAAGIKCDGRTVRVNAVSSGATFVFDSIANRPYTIIPLFLTQGGPYRGAI